MLPTAHREDLCIQLSLPRGDVIGDQSDKSGHMLCCTFASVTGLSKNPSGRLLESSFFVSASLNKKRNKHCNRIIIS